MKTIKTQLATARAADWVAATDSRDWATRPAVTGRAAKARVATARAARSMTPNDETWEPDAGVPTDPLVSLAGIPKSSRSERGVYAASPSLLPHQSVNSSLVGSFTSKRPEGRAPTTRQLLNTPTSLARAGGPFESSSFLPDFNQRSACFRQVIGFNGPATAQPACFPAWPGPAGWGNRKPSFAFIIRVISDVFRVSPTFSPREW